MYLNTYIIGKAFPMDMMDKYKIIVKYKGEQINPESEVSIKDYCDKVINGNYPENLKKLCKATLNYGSASEIYFNGKKYDGGTYQYDLSNLPNSDVDTSLNDVEKPASNGFRYDGDLGGKVTDIKKTLVIGAETSIKYYIYVDSLDLNETTIECLNGKPTTNLKKESGGRYSFKIENINALELGEEFVVNIKEGAEQMTITYSVYDYVTSKWDAGNNLANLCKKLVTYGEAAREYANITK